MRKSVITAAALLLTAAMTAGCGAGSSAQTANSDSSDNGEAVRYTASFLDAFDTKTDLVGYAEDEEGFQEQAELLKEKLTEYHRLYDIYNSYEGINNLCTINENAGQQPVEVSEEILDLLEMSIDMYEETEGQVNIAMGSVLSLWHEYREYGVENPEDASLPSREELEEAALHTNIEDIVIDREASTVFLKDPEMSLDVGGIGKGYAVQRLYEYAEELGIDSLLISVGGNISARGTRIDGTKWVLGIQNPDTSSETEYIAKVRLQDECLVTSGDYQRYYYVDGEKYCHIIDPDTLLPASYCASVSIITADSGRADALSTAVFNMEPEAAMEYIDDLENTEAMWVMSDGSFLYSEGFRSYLVTD